MATVKTGRDVCPACDKYETYCLEGRGKKRRKRYDVCGLTISAPTLKLVPKRQSKKTTPPNCGDCGREMEWDPRACRGGKWVCPSCGGD